MACVGVTSAKWKVGVIKRQNNSEPYFLARPHQVDIQIIDDMIRGHQMKPVQSFTQGNPPRRSSAALEKSLLATGNTTNSCPKLKLYVDGFPVPIT